MSALFFRRLSKPEYFLRPGQLFRRLARGRSAAVPTSAIVDLPWGFPLEIAPRETIGAGIWRLGVHELAVSEVLWRLIDSGEKVVDVGANCGYFTSLMAARTGRGGVVWAFEPQPEMRRQLTRNTERWRDQVAEGQIVLQSFGLSDDDGHAQLRLPSNFDVNTGTAYIGNPTVSPSEGTSIPIETRRLDSVFGVGEAPAVLKIDVEGHEARVLAGAGDLLIRGGMRDIVFEEHRAYPAESMQLVERCGYSLYRIERGMLGPRLVPPNTSPEDRSWEAPNYLATRDLERARARLRKAGWMCL